MAPAYPGLRKLALADFGQRTPIVAREGGVVAGNGTLRAAVALGWDRIAVVDAGDLSPAEAAAYALADNRTAELAHWDMEALRRAVEVLEVDWGKLDDLALGDDDLAAIARDLRERGINRPRLPFSTGVSSSADAPAQVAARPHAQELHDPSASR